MTDPGPPTGGGSYRVEATTRAPVDVVWPLVGEARRWREWSFLTRSGLEREASPVPDGVGAVRRFSRYGVGSREEVVAWDPPGHLAYRILSGFPVRNYRADVTLTPDGTGTRIEWAGTYDPKWPGTGTVLAPVLAAMMRRFARDLATHADGLVAGPAPGA
ncbi:MAG TPA: SRPBCC family protein [Acidimicrobiales bacterium]